MAKPIIFTGDSVRQILEGKKSQTRRVMKPQPVLEDGLWTWGAAGWSDGMGYVPVLSGHSLETRNRYGRPGGQLWVKESYMLRARFDFDKPSEVPVKAQDRDNVWYIADRCRDKNGEYLAPPKPAWGVSRSALFMPRWASRLTLDLTRIRVEQVQMISEEDAVAEGCSAGGGVVSGRVEPYETDGHSAVDEYAALWDELNAKRGFSWDSDPWCWVLDFKVVEEGQA